MKTRITFVAILLALFVVLAGQAANNTDLSVTVSGHLITASGLTPGGSAVFFGVGLEPIPHAYMNRVRRWAVTVVDTTQSGAVTLDLHEEVPPASVWGVVDLSNAQYGTAKGPGVALRQIALANPLRKGQSQNADQFLFDHDFLDLLYVHPGGGAWTWSVVGGTFADQDGARNSAIVSLIDGQPVGQAGQKPSSFLPGGTLVAIDFSRLQIAVVHLDQQLIAGAR